MVVVAFVGEVPNPSTEWCIYSYGICVYVGR